MTYFGTKEILKNHKSAFFCSRKCPAEIILKSFDWAIEQREKGNCVIIGAHSPIEKDVFHFLMKGRQPIILVLGRSIPIKLDPKILKAIEEHRLLIVSFTDKSSKRISKDFAEKRNRFIMDFSDEIVVGYANPGGLIEKSLEEFTKIKPVKFL